MCICVLHNFKRKRKEREYQPQLPTEVADINVDLYMDKQNTLPSVMALKDYLANYFVK
jgi:hypothetical protein